MVFLSLEMLGALVSGIRKQMQPPQDSGWIHDKHREDVQTALGVPL